MNNTGITPPLVAVKSTNTNQAGNCPINDKGVSRVIAYARASPGSPDPQPQIEEVRAWATRCGFVVVGEFVDNQVSGKDFERPAWRKAKQALDGADAIVCVRLDRFGRSTEHILAELRDLKARRKHLITLDGVVDTSKSVGGVHGLFQDLIIGIFASIVEFQRKLFLEKAEIGKRRARERGVKFGRPPAVNKEDAETVVALHSQGWSQNKLAAKFKVSRAAIKSCLERQRDKKRGN